MKRILGPMAIAILVLAAGGGTQVRRPVVSGMPRPTPDINMGMEPGAPIPPTPGGP